MIQRSAALFIPGNEVVLVAKDHKGQEGLGNCADTSYAGCPVQAALLPEF